MAQTKNRSFRQREIGFFGGGSYYIGDINPRNHFKFSCPATGIFFRYSNNYRFAFRFGLNYGTIQADDAASKEADQLERNLNFRSRIYEGHSVAEFNFLDYRIGQDKYRYTLYVFAGMAGFYFDPQTNIGGNYQTLRDFKTEGQSKKYARIQVSLPFGVGFKWNIGERYGVNVEWGPRKTYTDYLDDVSGVYPDLSLGNGNGFTDRTKNGSASTGGMRGNPITRDWYFYYGVSFQIRLPEPNPSCHGLGSKSRRKKINFWSIF